MLAWDFDAENRRPPKLRTIRLDAAVRLLSILEPIDGPVEGLRVLPSRNLQAATRVFQDLIRAESDELEFIGSDGFVDTLA